MKTVSQDTNIPIYAQIFTDSIAEEGKEGDSYYNMMKYNLDKIAEGLVVENPNSPFKNVILLDMSMRRFARIGVFIPQFPVKSLEKSERFM